VPAEHFKRLGRVSSEVLQVLPASVVSAVPRLFIRPGYFFWFQGLASLVAFRGVFSSFFVAVPSVNNPTLPPLREVVDQDPVGLFVFKATGKAGGYLLGRVADQALHLLRLFQQP
jgi:hypothetical protein